MPKSANTEPIVTEARFRIVDLPSVAAQFISHERVITEAVRHYMTAIRLPEVARALHCRAEDLESASQALRKLIQAAEELDEPVMDPGSLGRCFPALLAEHQATWRSAFRSRIEGDFVDSVRDAFSDHWQTAFLPVLLDRSIRSAGVVKFSDFDWLRIFGKPRQESKPWSICCSDGYFSAQHGLRVPMDSQFIMPRWPAAVLGNSALGMHVGDDLATEYRVAQTRLHVYDYGPIGDQDLSISIEAMRNTVASIDSMRRFICSSIVFIEKNKLVSRDYAYELLNRHGISTGAFHRALSPLYRVTQSSIEKARARHRRAQQQGQADSQPVQEKKNGPKRGNGSPAATKKC